MAVAADGYAHARFVGEFFDGPIDSYSAVSSDNGVATAGVNPPDMLIVAPVSNGTASITVTAFGPGGTATQTFVARVGAGSVGVARPAAAPTAPRPAPPPRAPGDSDPLLPTEDLPAVSDSDESTTTTEASDDDIPTEPLPPAPQATEAPSLSGNVSEQILSVGQIRTVDLSPYFDGFIQGWRVESSNPTYVEVTMTVNGQATIRGLVEGLSMVTVTAQNSLGSVAQAIRVVVSRGSGGAGTPTPGPDAPVLTLGLGQTIRVDLADYFPEGTTGFNVVYDAANAGGRIDVRVRGSEATIRGVQVGEIVVTLAATRSGQRVTQLATVEIAPL